MNAIIVPQQMQTWKRDSHNLVKEWLTNVETTYFEHERYFWKEYNLDWLGYVFTQLQLFQKDDFCWLDTGSRGQRGEDTAKDCDKRLQGSAERRFPGLVNFVTASCNSASALPAAFTQPGDHFLSEPCTALMSNKE